VVHKILSPEGTIIDRLIRSSSLVCPSVPDLFLACS